MHTRHLLPNTQNDSEDIRSFPIIIKEKCKYEFYRQKKKLFYETICEETKNNKKLAKTPNFLTNMSK